LGKQNFLEHNTFKLVVVAMQNLKVEYQQSGTATLIILQPVLAAKAVILKVNLLKMATDRLEVAKMPTPIPIFGAGQEAVPVHVQTNPLPVVGQEKLGLKTPAVWTNTAIVEVAAAVLLRMLLAAVVG
jgi:hypothetical protein